MINERAMRCLGQSVTIRLKKGDAEAKDNDSDAVNQDMDVHKRFVWAWEKRKTKL